MRSRAGRRRGRGFGLWLPIADSGCTGSVVGCLIVTTVIVVRSAALVLRRGPGILGLDRGDRGLQRVALGLEFIIGKRRVQRAQLGKQRRSRAVIDGSAHFGSGIRKALDGPGDQWMIIGHIRLC